MDIKFFGNLEAPCESLVRVASEAKRTRIRAVDVSRLVESNEVHVDSVLGDVKDLKHEVQIVSANFADADCVVMHC